MIIRKVIIYWCNRSQIHSQQFVYSDDGSWRWVLPCYCVVRYVRTAAVFMISEHPTFSYYLLYSFSNSLTDKNWLWVGWDLFSDFVSPPLNIHNCTTNFIMLNSWTKQKGLQGSTINYYTLTYIHYSIYLRVLRDKTWW